MIAGFAVAPIRNGGPLHVLFNAHPTHFPTLTAPLENNGRMLREYWHSGFFDAALVHDIDGDGKSEIHLGGTNNARRMAELVVLDPERFAGAGDESATPAFQIRDMQQGVEIGRILLPETCVRAPSGSQYNSAVEIQPTQGEVRVAVSEGLSGPAAPLLFYQFDGSLRLIRMETPDTFLSAHRRLRGENLLDHAWSDADRYDAASQSDEGYRFRSRAASKRPDAVSAIVAGSGTSPLPGPPGSPPGPGAPLNTRLSRR